MRFLFAAFLLAVALLHTPTARAQRPKAAGPPRRNAAATPPKNVVRPTRARLACPPLGGQVFDPNGAPLLGATLLVKGTQQVYVTNAEGRFELTAPVYQGQVLAVQAAGFAGLDVPLVDCTLPRLVLARASGARIKRNGKRAGQVLRLNKSAL